MLRTESDVAHREGVCQKFGLVVKMRPRKIMAHFLKEGDVRLEFRKDRNHPIDAIASVDPTDPLMDVPRYDTEAHGTERESEGLLVF
jgi:hypothetical protein